MQRCGHAVCCCLLTRTPPRAVSLMDPARKEASTTAWQNNEVAIYKHVNIKASCFRMPPPERGTDWVPRASKGWNWGGAAATRSRGPRHGPRPEARARRVGQPLRPALERRVPCGMVVAYYAAHGPTRLQQALYRKMQRSVMPENATQAPATERERAAHKI